MKEGLDLPELYGIVNIIYNIDVETNSVLVSKQNFKTLWCKKVQAFGNFFFCETRTP